MSKKLVVACDCCGETVEQPETLGASMESIPFVLTITTSHDSTPRDFCAATCAVQWLQKQVWAPK